jgi:hypothetical protein
LLVSMKALRRPIHTIRVDLVCDCQPCVATGMGTIEFRLFSVLESGVPWWRRPQGTESIRLGINIFPARPQFNTYHTRYGGVGCFVRTRTFVRVTDRVLRFPGITRDNVRKESLVQVQSSTYIYGVCTHGVRIVRGTTYARTVHSSTCWVHGQDYSWDLSMIVSPLR